MFRLQASTASQVTIEVLNKQGAVSSSNTFSNIMTNIGLLSWARGSLGTHIAIGSGNQEEIESVTSLVAYGRSQSGSYTYYDTNFIDEVNGVMRTTHRLQVLFPTESIAQNYSELGIHNNNINQLQTYALIRDTENLPTVISVLAGEQVRATYDVQYSLPLQYVLNKDIAGVPTTLTVVPYRTGQSNAIRLPETQSNNQQYWPAGQPIPEPFIQPAGGVAGSVAASVSQNQWSMAAQLTHLNLDGGISLMRLGNTSQPSIMVHFDPPIPKTADVGMVIRVLSSLENGEFYA